MNIVMDRSRPLVALVGAVMLALLAQFPLEGPAERNDLIHWAQHGLLFWSGAVAGAAALVLYRRGQREV